MPSVPVSLAVLVSGEGSNLQALIDHSDGTYKIAVVISDRNGIGALSRARDAGIPFRVVEWADFVSRDEFTAAVCGVAQTYAVSGLMLAGFMRVLSPSAMSRFPDAIINVHPALLPSFPGTNAVDQALERGVIYTGVTVHFVDEQVDHGPIIAQRTVRVNSDDDTVTLHSRIQAVEHELFPQVVAAFARGDFHVESGRVRWKAPLHSGSAR
jgi:phosphoribosylglycinamide formyltransferase-1